MYTLMNTTMHVYTYIVDIVVLVSDFNYVLNLQIAQVAQLFICLNNFQSIIIGCIRSKSKLCAKKCAVKTQPSSIIYIHDVLNHLSVLILTHFVTPPFPWYVAITTVSLGIESCILKSYSLVCTFYVIPKSHLRYSNSSWWIPIP